MIVPVFNVPVIFPSDAVIPAFETIPPELVILAADIVSKLHNPKAVSVPLQVISSVVIIFLTCKSVVVVMRLFAGINLCPHQ